MTQPSPGGDPSPQANVSLRGADVSDPTQPSESRTSVVSNCNQQAVSMPGLTHTNPTFKHLRRSHILLSPPSMPVSQLLILAAPLAGHGSFYRHKMPLSARPTAAEPGFPGPVVEPQLRAIFPHHPALRNAEIK